MPNPPMTPKRVIERRAPSPRAVHPQQHLFGCWGLMELDVSSSAVVLEVCDRCGRTIKKWAVIPEPQRARPDTTWDDDDPSDCSGGRAW